MENKRIGEFSVALTGTPVQYNQVLSKGRCRIFYRGLNRNGGFITDEFAEKLISTLPYTPVKGIYDDAEGDYTDHGQVRRAGRIYGIVPENPNVIWEMHTDEDGVERCYATCDVLLFTAIYEEAAEILTKSQSMELYWPSLKGNWENIDGNNCYVYTEGCFLGLQVLGDETEPCFEGAAFYTLRESLKEILMELEKYNLVPKGGKNKMEYVFNFEGAEKFAALWNSINSEVNEEGKLLVSYSICEIAEDSLVVMNHATGEYSKASYSVDEEGKYTVGEFSICNKLEVSDAEATALNALKELNNGSYEGVDTEFSARGASVETLNASVEALNGEVENLKGQISEFEQKKVELEAANATLSVEKEEIANNFANATAQIEEKDASIASLTSEVEELRAYKKNIEDAQKQEVINSYAVKLAQEVLDQYTAKMDTYASVIDLDKDLAYEVKKAEPQLFSSQSGEPTYLVKDQNLESGLEAILSKYKK